MSETTTRVPPAAQQAARRGNLIEAIRLTREQTGLGLMEAKQAVDAWLAGTTRAPLETGDVAIPLQAALALRHGRLIDAIRHTREATGLGLKDAKEAVERHLAKEPSLQAEFRAATTATWRRIAGRALLLLGLTALAAMAYVALIGNGV